MALELAFQLITGIPNREGDLPLVEGLELLSRHEPEKWIVQLLNSPLDDDPAAGCCSPQARVLASTRSHSWRN
jgi:hypothetical protein